MSIDMKRLAELFDEKVRLEKLSKNSAVMSNPNYSMALTRARNDIALKALKILKPEEQPVAATPAKPEPPKPEEPQATPLAYPELAVGEKPQEPKATDIYSVISNDAVVQKIEASKELKSIIGSEALSALKAEIASTEAMGKTQEYKTVNISSLSPSAKREALSMDITKLTAKQILDLQKSGRLGAAGKFQITPGTMADMLSGKGLSPEAKDAWQKLGPVKPTDAFTPDTQEKAFVFLILKRRSLTNYVAGKVEDTPKNLSKAADDLAYEFASIPIEKNLGGKRGGTAYPETKNIAKGGPERIRKIKGILRRLRKSGVLAEIFGGNNGSGSTG